jgi:uncharacterized coiled-coil protein SlyX
MFESGQELTDRVMEVQKQIADGRDQLLGEIQNLDAAWNDAAARPGSQIMRRLQEIESALGFAERWISQLRERVVRLAL